MKKSRILIPIVLAILSMHPVPTTAAQLDTWTWRNPLPTGNQLNGVTHGLINGKNLWVAVGANNTILTSPNGTTWDQQMSPSTPNCSLSSVVYSSQSPHFVAVGADAATPLNNVILTSPDGTTWTAATGPLGSGGLLAVASDGNGNFLAVGNGGVNLYYSSSGVTWVSGSTIPGGQDFDGVAYGDGMFVAVGGAGSIYTTINGSGWTSQDSSPQLTSYTLFGITYNSSANDGTGGFVVVGDYDILNSANGTSWNDTSGDSANAVVNAVVNGIDEFVTVNDTTYYVYTSPGSSTAVGGTDTWTSYNVNYPFYAIDWDGVNTFVAVGPDGTIATSPDGIIWSPVNTSVTGGELNAIAYGTSTALPSANLFVAGGAGNNQQPVVVWSPDGYNWELDTDPSINNSQFYNWFITGLTYGTVSVSPPGGGGGGTGGSGGSPGGGGTGGGSPGSSPPAFVATVNTYQGISDYASVILSSTSSSSKGPIWAPVYTSKLNVLNGIVCGQNTLGQSLFVAVGNGGTVVSSTTPSVPGSWMSPISPPTLSSSLNAVAYGVGSFAAVGMYGTILYSSDGNASSWNAPILIFPTDSSDTFTSVAYGNGMFVAVGYYESIEFAPVGVIYTSSNGGVSWIQQVSSITFTPPVTSQPPFNSITFANGLFVAVSNDNSGNGGDIFVSPDGVNWTQSSIAAPSLNAIVYGNYQYIAVGDGGEILGSQLPAASGASFNTVSGCFSFVVSGPPGTYGVYYSNDLSMPLPWNFVQNISFTSTSYSTTVVDCNAGNSPNGFYYLGPKGP